eukprot:c3217_g1_i1.p1 GENE.c3217_g1_i1~~c3217_g1_i1.p1  ORF type:complete len:367 (-),score=89.32 c3217_g1_i1:49-1110(-)
MDTEPIAPEVTGDATDPALAARQEEFARRMQERMTTREEQRKKASENPDAIAKQDLFQKISEYRNKIQELIIQTPNKAGFDEWASKTKAPIAEFEDLVARYSFMLTPYDKEASSRDIQKWRTTIEAKQTEIAPKKFSFKSKTATTTPTPTAAKPTPTPPTSTSSSATSAALTPENYPGIFDSSNDKFIRFPASQQQVNEEYAIARCTDATIVFAHRMGAVRIQGLTRCHVGVGPVSGAIYVIDCTDCVLHLASHQVRIHNCVGCEFRLHVQSNPIIEHCSNVRFGPYGLRYSAIAEHFQALGWDVERSNESNWKNVQDFNWLRTTPSPNWHALEPSNLELWKPVEDTIENKAN